MSTAGRDPLLSRLERDSLLVAVALAIGAAILWPGRPARALGVIGGFALIAISYRGLRAGVEGLWGGPTGAHCNAPARDETTAAKPRSGFVKFFTRHAILAFGAYVMMARFEFDPMAMLVGVTAPAFAATVEFVRTVRARQGGPHSRSS